MFSVKLSTLLFCPGMDWKWGDQDGGAGNHGVVYEVQPDKWVKVIMLTLLPIIDLRPFSCNTALLPNAQKSFTN